MTDRPPSPPPDAARLRAQMTRVLDTGPSGQDLLRTIHLLARTGSYNAAGARLRVNPGTVRRRVAALGAALGAALVQRTDTSGVALTPVGEAVAALARPVVLDWVSRDA